MLRTLRRVRRPAALVALVGGLLVAGEANAFADSLVLRDSSPTLVTTQAGLCTMDRYEVEGHNGSAHEYAEGVASVSGGYGLGCWVSIRQSKDSGRTFVQSDLVQVMAGTSASTPIYYDGPGYYVSVCVQTLRNTWCDPWY